MHRGCRCGRERNLNCSEQLSFHSRLSSEEEDTAVVRRRAEREEREMDEMKARLRQLLAEPLLPAGTSRKFVTMEAHKLVPMQGKQNDRGNGGPLKNKNKEKKKKHLKRKKK